MKPFIPTTFYVLIQYLGGLLLITSPWVFGFVDIGGASYFIPVLMGILLMLIAVFSDSKLGIVPVFPMQMNLLLAMFAGFLLLVGPGLYSFTSKVHWPHHLLGALFFLLAIFTQGSPFTTKTHEQLPEAGMTSTDAHEGRLMV
ncbi:SPW repeat protein [Mucilaginibacter sp. HMF5004]|uniref:SPW repeat domain-containing protein n=1 Tax=Mucilaginibacter rivuli TaxID=2857527 RepID=UPI001C5E8794|nr:SPW repeat protein [Mucilaginibacter rivuli]MBW4889106.1 SPW repeat protein [Mucilaginibacter rivuli]